MNTNNCDIVSSATDRMLFVYRWYTPEEIHQSIRQDDIEIPSDVHSSEFAIWLCEQYRLTMLKGMYLMQNAMIAHYSKALTEKTSTND